MHKIICYIRTWIQLLLLIFSYYGKNNTDKVPLKMKHCITPRDTQVNEKTTDRNPLLLGMFL